MRSTLAVAALAFAAASPAVLAFGDMEAASKPLIEILDASAAITPSIIDKVSNTQPEQMLVTRLSEAQLAGATEPLVVIEAPPMFDPPEPRPAGIFVDEDGKIIDGLPRPPPIQLARPEVISAFEGSHVWDENTPYPPDTYDKEFDQALYPRSAWVHATSIIGGLAILLSIASIMVWFVERLLFSFWRASRRQQTLDPIDMWYEQSMLEKAMPRRRSFSHAADAMKNC